MLTLAAGSYKFPLSHEDRSFGSDANGVDSNGVDVSGNVVQIGSFNGFSVNLGNPAAGSREMAFAGHPSIAQRPGQTPLIGDEPVANIYPPTSGSPPMSGPPPESGSPPTSVPDFGGTFLLMLCSGAGLLITGRLASRQLKK
jgi:hypothetical protein